MINKYNIFQNHSGLTEAVKQGWSWPGFFFTWIWALVKKMNLIGGGTIGGFVFAIFLVTATRPPDQGESVNATQDFVLGLGVLGVAILFGTNGNTWRERNLITRGYELKATVHAETDESALALYANPGNESAGGPKGVADLTLPSRVGAPHESSQARSLESRLSELKDLRAKDLITEAEMQEKRRQILGL